MQKQKTIAKWLAVVLLVTVAIACYIVLSAILPNSSDASTEIADANSQNPTRDEPAAPKPIYSTLPRNCEHIDTLEVAHVGGEGSETLLDVVYCFSKTLVIFLSESTQYDVNESGIYIAVFEAMTLEKTLKIASSEQRYLGAMQARSGLIIATSTSNDRTLLTLYDEQLEACRQATLDYIESLHFIQIGSTLRAFAYDNQVLRCYTIDSSLNAKASSYIFSAKDLQPISLIGYGERALLFCNTEQGAVALEYSQNTGFIQRFCSKKHTIEQALPIISSGEQAFVLLLKNADRYAIFSLSSELKEGEKYLLDGVRSARLFQGQNGLEVLADSKLIRLCSHLDFISEKLLCSADENTDFLKGSYELKGFDGCDDLIAISNEGGCAIYSRDKELLTELFMINGTSDLQLLRTQAKTVLIFACINQNAFSYMCFGKSDVFLISY